jgi:serine/threonine-protein kinase
MSRRSERLEKQLGGKYRVERLVGRGGMGEVWAGLDVKLDCPVAIKVLNEELSRDAEYVERFRREMTTLAKLRHPRIVRPLTAGVLAPDGQLYLVMELLAGRTLRAILDGYEARGEVMDVVSAAFFAYQMVDGLGSAHAKGIIHRDVKPENMILDGAHLMLLDFGIAKASEVTGPRRGGASSKGDRLQAKKSTLLGTPRYMAPEVIESATFDQRSDLYAVGIILAIMLTGEYPYAVSADDETGILEAHVHQAPVLRRERNAGCPEVLWAIALRLLAKDPAQRYQDADEVGDDLSAVMRGSVPPSHPVAKQLEVERRERAHRDAYEKRGAPSHRPPAEAGHAVDVTTPLGRDHVAASPCAASAGVTQNDASRPLPKAAAPARVVDVSRMRLRAGPAPAVDETRPVPAGHLSANLPAWLAPPRRPAAVPEAQPARPARSTPAEGHWGWRPSRPVKMATMVLAVMLAWVTLVLMESWRRPHAVEETTRAATVPGNVGSGLPATAANTTAGPTTTAEPTSTRKASATAASSTRPAIPIPTARPKPAQQPSASAAPLETPARPPLPFGD